jgi:hypothetical protein
MQGIISNRQTPKKESRNHCPNSESLCRLGQLFLVYDIAYCRILHADAQAVRSVSFLRLPRAAFLKNPPTNHHVQFPAFAELKGRFYKNIMLRFGRTWTSAKSDLPGVDIP